MPHPVSPIRLLIVDDHPVVRQGLRSMLANHPRIVVVGEAGDGASALRQARATEPDVVLLDVRMPGADGIQLTRQLKQHHPSTRILILSTYGEDEYVFGAIRTGADGYLLKTTPYDNLVQAIERVHQGDRLIDPTLLGTVLDQFQALARDKVQRDYNLSEEEVAMLRQIADGATNKDIARTHYLSEATAKRKVQVIFRKLGVHDRAEAVAEAMGRGLI